jgi:hypothetical protein
MEQQEPVDNSDASTESKQPKQGEGENPPPAFMPALPVRPTENLPAIVSEPQEPSNESQQKARVRKTDLGVGVGGGSAIVLFAQTLPDPYKIWLSIAAPTISAVIASCFPYIRDYATLKIANYVDNHETISVPIKNLKKVISLEKERLKDRSLSKETRGQIEENIKNAQDAITQLRFQYISMHKRHG